MTGPAGLNPVLPAGGASGVTAAPADPAPGPAPPAGLSRLRIALLIAANFGAAMAVLGPMAYSLAVRVQQLAPGNPRVLGFVLGGGSLASLLLGPVIGTLSDRTRSRLGRRRPWTLGGTVLGLAGVSTMAAAQDLSVLASGWVMASLGWGTALASIHNVQADHLTRQQRGKVAGYTGFTGQLAAVVGVLLAGAVAIDSPLLFLLPGLVGLVLVLPFLVLSREEDSRALVVPGPLTAGRLLRAYVFSPRAHPDFAWNWLGRFVFFLGLYLTTTFTTYFFAERLDIGLDEVAGVVAVTATIGIACTLVGSLGAGWLSDRLDRRRPFVVASTVLFAVGTVVVSTADSLPALATGTALMSGGIAVFSAVNQAIVLDVLPERETSAGRYMAIFAFSQKIPSTVGPFLASVVVAVGATPDGPNYTLLYLVAGALAVVGGLVIGLRVRGVR